MWLLEMNNNKAKQYALEIYKHNKFSFDEKTGLKNRCRVNLQKTRSFKFLNKDRFDLYLYSEPKKLQELHQELFDYLFNHPTQTFNQKYFEEYICDVKDKKTNIRHSEYSRINDEELKTIQHIFNYSTYISRNTNFSYYLAKLLDVTTCPYCNRQYIFTIKNTNGEHIVRPEFDHWFAQFFYPDLALSYYNLIPCCHDCNSVLKNATSTSIETHIHPYVDKDRGFNFTFGTNLIGSYNVEIDITTNDPSYKKKVENTLNLFKIKEVYNAHSDFELKELIELAYANPKDYIDTLINEIMVVMDVDRETVIRILFGIEIEPSKYNIRPLSKFKSDIIKKLKNISL